MTMKLTFPVPPGAPVKECNSCGAAIIWILTPGAGKRMPVNADGHESHFATCPNAKQHRKSRA